MSTNLYLCACVAMLFVIVEKMHSAFCLTLDNKASRIVSGDLIFFARPPPLHGEDSAIQPGTPTAAVDPFPWFLKHPARTPSHTLKFSSEASSFTKDLLLHPTPSYARYLPPPPRALGPPPHICKNWPPKKLAFGLLYMAIRILNVQIWPPRRWPLGLTFNHGSPKSGGRGGATFPLVGSGSTPVTFIHVSGLLFWGFDFLVF